MRRKLFVLGIVLMLILCGCNEKVEETEIPDSNDNDKEVSIIQGSFAIDVASYAELAGDADYVIIGKVVEELNTEHRGSVILENEDGTEREESTPYTNYCVEVQDNLKGELRQDEAIIITKKGGLTKDGKEYYIYSDDVLPVEGESYVFYIYAQEDGSNLSSGPNSTIPISETGNSGITTRNVQEDSENGNDILEQIKEGIVNQVISERERSVSKDDMSVKE